MLSITQTRGGVCDAKQKKKKERDKTTGNPSQSSTAEPVGPLASDHPTVSADPSCNHDTVPHPATTALY